MQTSCTPALREYPDSEAIRATQKRAAPFIPAASCGVFWRHKINSLSTCHPELVEGSSLNHPGLSVYTERRPRVSVLLVKNQYFPLPIFAGAINLHPQRLFC